MYAMMNDDLLTGEFSFRKFKRFVAERRSFDADRSDDTIYRWYRSDRDLIDDRPAVVMINRGEHYRDLMGD